MSSIKDNLYWGIKDQLAGVRKPENLEEVEYLRALGIGGFISLLDDKENHQLYEKAQINYLWLPVKGGTSPSLEQVEKALEFFLKVKNEGKALAVHCTGGRKRTGTLLAAMMVKNGESLNRVLAILLESNPEIILNQQQAQFLKKLEDTNG